MIVYVCVAQTNLYGVRMSTIDTNSVRLLIKNARDEDMLEHQKRRGEGGYWEIIEDSLEAIFFAAFGPDVPVTKTNVYKVLDALENGEQLIQVGEESTVGMCNDICDLAEMTKAADQYALQPDRDVGQDAKDISKVCRI